MDGRLSLPKNAILGESYRIDRVIGSGGFGITYEAEDIHLGTRVAIKEYCPEEFGTRDERMRVGPKSERQRPTFDWGLRSFLQEARTLARFRHPSVVQVTRVFEAYSTAYMVMTFEEGKDFEGWLRGLGRSPTQEEMDRIAGPLLDALELMHAQDFLHRDIAPDNIIVRTDGTPLLLDFGAARRAVAERSRTLTGIVKTGYSPFEQYATDGRLQGPWTDLYAFGATLYRAVTGKSPEEATLRIADDRMVPAVAAATAAYRPGFLIAVDVCLRPKHAERPQSVAELRPMLLGREPPVETKRLVATRRIGPPVRAIARRWPIVTAGVLVLFGAAYGGVHYARWSAEEQLRSEIEVKRRADQDRAAKRAAEEVSRKAEATKIADASKAKADAEAAAWAAIKDTTSIPALEAFIAQHKDSAFTELARKRVSALKIALVTPGPVDRAPRKLPEAGTAAACDGIEIALGKGERRCMKPGESFKDCSECPEMVALPAGDFTMGSSDGLSDERPPHRVSFRAPFAVAKYEATFADWEACVVEKQCASVADEGWGKGRRPVINITWRAATDYTAWLSEKTNRKYRLLSEAEWEYAARAGTTTQYAFGDAVSEGQAHYSVSALSRQRRTVEVGSFRPNGFGLYDMHGNVSEWVADNLHPDYANAPQDGSAWTGGDPSISMIRGGSWNDDANTLRSAYRGRLRTGSRSPLVGFRVARTLD